MALDEALLIDAAENSIATLRFYQWNEPTLSLGYFQRYNDRHQHAASRACAIVRRQTGGGAILHDHELTYSLALPPVHPLARKNETLYSVVHDAFIAGLRATISTTDADWVLTRRNQESSLSSNVEPFLCFRRQARGDVLLSNSSHPDSGGAKILGSAQRRHRGAVLQHGSLLLEKSPAAPELPGIRDLVGPDVASPEISATVTVRLIDALAVKFTESPLPQGLELKSRELANTKYGSAEWTKRR